MTRFADTESYKGMDVIDGWLPKSSVPDGAIAKVSAETASDFHYLTRGNTRVQKGNKYLSVFLQAGDNLCVQVQIERTTYEWTV